MSEPRFLRSKLTTALAIFLMAVVSQLAYITTPVKAVSSTIVISEVDADTPLAGTDTANEWFELQNVSASSITLTNWTITDNTSSDTLPTITIGPGGHVIIAATAPGFASEHSSFVGSVFTIVDGTIGNGLANGGDVLTLKDAGGAVVDAVSWGSNVNALNPAPATDSPTNTNQRNAAGTDTDTAADWTRAAETPNGGTTPTPTPTPTATPTPTPVNSVIVISQVYGGGGNNNATYQNDFVELYNRGTMPVDIGGWSLQYAAATGSGWDFNKQPLGGTIAPGEYYLIALASNGAAGLPLPAANISGQINMAAGSGKIALVGNFDALEGNCPTSDPDLKDLVGYGTADCREGATAAPAASVMLSLFRLGNGSQDTNVNGNDFVTGSPNPRRTAPIVELGPLVLATDPRTNGVNAPRDATIQVTFTEPVDVFGQWFDITCAMTGMHNSATFATLGRDHYITPNINFLAGETCTVTIFKEQVHDQDLDDVGTNTDTLAANYVWSFTVATGTAPPFPASIHLTMGNPSGATSDVGQPNNYLMEKPEYSLSYNRDYGRPNWVSWHLSDEWVGSLTRVDTFRPDPAVPPDWYRVHLFDFSGSGFDRGHMVPNADRDKETSIPINQATFLMTNMLAQSPDNNQGPWARFENYLRTLLPANEIYIVAGGVGIGGTGMNGFATTIANGKVTVPSHTWKVALVIPKESGDDMSRVSCGSRTIAILMPNVQGIEGDMWEKYLTTVDAVETLTGYDFFSNLPEPVQRCVEAGINGTNPPLDTDADGDPDTADNCPFVSNPNQEDFDNDTIGDACDPDDDNDGVADASDQCPNTPLGTQVNAAGCPDADGDGVADTADNCPLTPNPDQRDTNGDGVGDVCTSFQFPAGGAFVIGDQVSLSAGATVYFWGSQWAKKNPMTGGSGPSAFKGFENSLTSPACAGSWTTNAGGEANPPAVLPEYMAVIVSSSIEKNGSIVSGNIKKIIVVRTNPGYAPTPDHPGTGQVVAILCGNGN